MIRKNNTKKDITIIGSGLAGSFLAVLLARLGYQVTIYERLSKEEICDIASKRSYNITIYGYAIDLLKKAGLWEEIHPHLLPLQGSMTHIPNRKKPISNLVNLKKISYFTVSRAKFADVLLKSATRDQNVNIHYQSPLIAIDRHKKTLIIGDESKNFKTISTDVLIGADGANSLVRIFIQQGQETEHRQELSEWRYRQFLLPEKAADRMELERGVVHTWTQKNTFIIMHPNSSNGFSALLVFPNLGSEEKIFDTEQKTNEFFKENFPDFLPVLSEITESLFSNPDGYFGTIHSNPWYYKDFMALIGDAAHGFYPFFGQGTTAAFADSLLLCKKIEQYQTDWKKIFSSYQNERKRHTDALGDMSKDALINYLRFRKADKTAMYDKLEMAAYKLFPKIIVPPPFLSIVSDPDHADDHRRRYVKQKRVINLLGASLFVTAVAGAVSVFEQFFKRTNNK